MSDKRIIKHKKFTKKEFIEAVVYKQHTETNKDLASKLDISTMYFYKLLDRYAGDISHALTLKKSKLRLKAINVIEAQLDKMDVKTALEVLKQIGYSEATAELTGGFNIKLAAIAELLINGGNSNETA